MTLSRRNFVTATAGAAIAAYADPMGLPIGTQTWPIRDLLSKDFEGTLKQVSAMGYRTIELCSPHSYGEFKALAAIPPEKTRATIEGAGLRCESCHYGFREMKENPDERIAFAKGLGLKQMVVSTFGLPATATLQDWKTAASTLNGIGERTQKAGIQLGFHNHNGEFAKLDDTLIYDALLQTLDPKLVKLQFQVAVISLGVEAATYLKKYPGRFLSLHLADYSTAEKKGVAVGQGVVDWKGLFAAAKSAGVQNYFVEMNLEFMAASYAYLHKM
ncbi:MAG: sugar phosphate isomerase/epimerase [Candidatus Solibacter sp.]